jgi:hypothetical protein
MAPLRPSLVSYAATVLLACALVAALSVLGLGLVAASFVAAVATLCNISCPYSKEVSNTVLKRTMTDILEKESFEKTADWLRFPSKAYAGEWNVHSLIVDSGNENPSLLVVHGVGGDCLSFLPMMNALSKDFKIYVPDLPGFGLSTAPPAPTTNPDQVVVFFCDFLKGYLEAHGISQVMILPARCLRWHSHFFVPDMHRRTFIWRLSMYPLRRTAPRTCTKVDSGKSSDSGDLCYEGD